MKRFKSILLAAGFIGILAACNNIDDPVKVDKGQSLVLNISAVLTTKATTDKLPAEEAIKDLQVYVFKKNGSVYELYRYIDTVITAPTAQTSASWEIKGVNANESYSVAVFANGLASGLKYPAFQNRDALRAQAVTLASSVPGAQFTMYGETASDVEVSSNTATQVNVTVQRFVSRVRLMSVQNKLPEAYGVLTVKRVFVINAYDSWNMFGTGTSISSPAGITGRFNWGGETAGVIIASANDCKRGDVAYGAQTFASFNEPISNYFVKLAEPGATEASAKESSTWEYSFSNGLGYKTGVPFYVFPNAHAADPNSDSFRGSLANYAGDAPSRLVVYAEITNNNQTVGYYYPVTVPAMERNKSYDVNLLVTGFGSDHPNREPEKGSMELSVNVKPWDEGQTIPQEY